LLRRCRLGFGEVQANAQRLRTFDGTTAAATAALAGGDVSTNRLGAAAAASVEAGFGLTAACLADAAGLAAGAAATEAGAGWADGPRVTPGAAQPGPRGQADWRRRRASV
jgi:hypothetical protein